MFTSFPSDKKKLSKPDSLVMDDVKHIAQYIQKDSFLMAQVAQIDITPQRTYEITPVLGDQLIKIGNADDLEEVIFILQPDGQVKKVKVRTDIQDINYIEILSGLKEGDEVITGPYDVVSKTLKEGAKVKVVPKSELFDKKK